MAALSRLFERSAPALVASGDQYRHGLQDLFAFRANSYASKVTADSALGVSAFYRAVRIIADVGAAMPIDVFDKTGGARIPVDTQETQWCWRRPNPEINRFVFWQTMIGNLVMHNEAFAYIVADPAALTRRPLELWPIEPERVTNVGRDSQGRKVYEIDGQTPALDWRDGGEIWHLKHFSLSGLRGTSLLQLFALGLSISRTAENYAGAFFRNDSTPGGYLSTDQPLTPAQADEISEGWELIHQGSTNAHRLAVLGRGTKWMTVAATAKDAQLLESRAFQVSEVARMTGVPEHLLGSHDKQSSWGTGISEQNRGLVTFTLDPYLVNIELAVSDDLLTQRQYRYMKFNRGQLLRADPREQADILQIERRNGVINANEWRALMDREPIGPDGDEYIIEMNMQMLGDAAAPAPLAPPAPDGGTDASN